MCPKEDRMHVARIMANQGHTQKYIAEYLGVSDRMVRKYLNPEFGTHPRKTRESILKPFYPIIEDTLENDPYFNLVYLHERLKNAGYTGKMTILRNYARQHRKKLIEKAVIRFETEPGRQAQVDWKECGKMEIDGRFQKVYAFVMLLGYSRIPFVLFTLDMTTSTLLQAHLMAFKYFGAVPKEILYDNMRTAWYNSGSVWQVNSKLLEFASTCGFTPLRCQVRRPQTKGKVERFIGYLGHSFLIRNEVAQAGTLKDLNHAVSQWINTIVEKQMSQFRETRKERFEYEKAFMNPWNSAAAPDVRLIKEIIVSREGVICYETNKYSVPAQNIGRTAVLKVDTLMRTGEIFIYEESVRSFDLLPKGSKSESIRQEDRESLLKRWKRENRRETKKVVARVPETNNLPKSPLMQTEVEVRHPGSYDRLMGATA
ncbi:IS21 family transposase [Oceanispirochaeta crateris]|uniref:IS21 family transposase n=2 Tax=Oceanispirochaeta crateris TaxID=2518645 RepID=A0A5C1QQW5_9SPIO|nr:IS21 family transposase [Oceanispirochaeta crateris]